MLRTQLRYWTLALALIGTILTNASAATAPNISAQLRIRGKVNVNGKAAVSGPLSSGDTVKTAINSSAVVSLGKLGRVEVLPDSNAKIEFADASVKVTMFEAGRVRVSSSSNVSATVVTKEGQITGDKNQANEFTVDNSCGNLVVSTKKGLVELRAGSTVKQIRAGSSETVMAQCK